MSVEITPSGQLGFTRPLTRLVTQTIKIHNPNSAPVAFKVKTTAPKQYCVRPNSGRVESGESVEVQVLLQPLVEEPPPHAKCKDKFLVQSAYISPDEEMHTLAEMWAQTERTNKAAIHEQKIKSVYLASEDGSHANGIREEDEEAAESRVMDESALFSAAQSSPLGQSQMNGHPSSPTAAAAGAGAALAAPIPSSAAPAQTGTPALRDAPAASSGAGLPELSAAQAQATNSALARSLETTTTDADKVRVLMAEVERLQSQAQSAGNNATGFGATDDGPQVTGLRRRGGGSVVQQVGDKAEVAVEKAKEAVTSNGSGVPLEVVVGLLVATFVMTYLFF